jgi:hypothetical protein
VEDLIPASTADVRVPPVQDSNGYRTEPDSYGVVREYLQGKPSITPDELYSLADVSEFPYLALGSPDSQPHATSRFASPLQTILRGNVSHLYLSFQAIYYPIQVF